MKNAIRFIIVILVLVSGEKAFSYDYVDIVGGSCTGKVAAWSKMLTYQNGDYSANFTSCSDSASAYKDSHAWGADCSASIVIREENPSVCLAVVCCTQETVNTVSNQQRTLGQSAVISNVPAGSEKEAAEQFAGSWNDSNLYYDVPGKVRTDGAVGISYVATMGTDETHTDVQVVVWKRGVYTNVGDNQIPLDDLGGTGGGGGGVDARPNIDALGSKMDSFHNLFTYNQGSANRMEAIQDTLYSVGEAAGAWTDYYMEPKLTDIKNAVKGGPYNPTALTGGSFTPSESHDKNIGTVISDFQARMQATGIGSMMTSFAGGIPASSVSSMTISGGRFGNNTFDFSRYAALWAVIGGVIMVLAAYRSVRIIIHPAAGG